MTIVLATALAVFGCGSEEETPTEGATQDNRIELTFEGDEAPPVERVQVEAGETVELVITSDQPGELHVHSEPEETIEYGAGTTTYKLTNLEKPGVVDVERHEPEALVLQLEIS